MKLYTFTDEDGDKLKIEPSDEVTNAALVQAITGPDSVLVRIPAHRLAEVVAAMYEAAGQPVPDLPVIHDQAEVNRLAELIHYAAQGTIGYGSADFSIARVLLAHGVRLPEATS